VISRSNLSDRVHRGTPKTSWGARRPSSGYLNSTTGSVCGCYAELLHPTWRCTDHTSTSCFSPRKNRCEWSLASKQIACRLARGCGGRALARCRSSAGARWQVGVDRAGARGGRTSSWKSMVGSRSREAAVRRDSSYHAVAYQSCLTVGVPLSFFFFPPPLSW